MAIEGFETTQSINDDQSQQETSGINNAVSSLIEQPVPQQSQA